MPDEKPDSAQRHNDPPNGESTERQSEREQEDRTFTPVIIKRNDQATRHPDDTLALAIREGAEQAKRPALSLLLSAVAAGAILAFTALAVGVMSEVTGPDAGPILERLSRALVYPLGFVLCLMSGTQLFTEHTALAVYPVLDRECRFVAMLRIWGLVLAGNLLGCLLGAALLWAASDVVDADGGFAAVAEHTLAFGALDTLLSAVLAGWLMALGGWLLLATPPDVSQIVVIYMVTFLIGLGGLHHSIAGATELMVARFTGAEVPLGGAAATIGLAVLGNLAGGALFVAVLNYGYVRQTQVREPRKP
jgi:formate/nitrite transporter FocA (FNT family)